MKQKQIRTERNNHSNYIKDRIQIITIFDLFIKKTIKVSNDKTAQQKRTCTGKIIIYLIIIK